jgi:hypothetical protein
MGKIIRSAQAALSEHPLQLGKVRSRQARRE